MAIEIVDFPSYNVVMFHSDDKLPEGNPGNWSNTKTTYILVLTTLQDVAGQPDGELRRMIPIPENLAKPC